jgi:hypothetical protein
MFYVSTPSLFWEGHTIIGIKNLTVVKNNSEYFNLVTQEDYGLLSDGVNSNCVYSE